MKATAHRNKILVALQFLLAAAFLFFGSRKLIGDEVRCRDLLRDRSRSVVSLFRRDT